MPGLWAVLGTGILVACIRLQVTPTPVSLPTVKWTIDLDVAGGISGVHNSLSLSSSGELTAADLRTGKVVKATLPAEERTQIEQMLQAADLSTSRKRPVSCPDCFTYSLTINMNGMVFSANASDVDKAGLGPLLQKLNSLLTHTLSH